MEECPKSNEMVEKVVAGIRHPSLLSSDPPSCRELPHSDLLSFRAAPHNNDDVETTAMDGLPLIRHKGTYKI